jgi:hypothetical protein
LSERPEFLDTTGESLDVELKVENAAIQVKSCFAGILFSDALSFVTWTHSAGRRISNGDSAMRKMLQNVGKSLPTVEQGYRLRI